MKKLVLFIHGLGGSAKGTWKSFPALIGSDPALADQYDVAAFEYSTGGLGSKPSLAKIAAILKTELDNRYPTYPDIALIAHSQGGLVARYYIAERLNSEQPLRVSRLLTFATPHQGSGFATWLRRVPFASQQGEDLDPNSEFLQTLAVAWGQAKPEQRGLLTKYVVAAGDAIVGQVSAMGQWDPGYEVVGGDGHLAVVKPETADHTSFLIARKFLLEDGRRPGGVEPDYRPPRLRFNYVEAKESTRFIYSARALPLIGREAEKDLLADFLGGPEQPFRWMVMVGSGGVGKSRLALELCLSVRSEWHAGFLPQNGQEPDWGRWQPLLPTLIVVDYAARDTERSGKLLQALAGRGPGDGTLRLAAPIRVLLIERTVAEGVELMGANDWLSKVIGFGTAQAQLEAARAANLVLTTVDNLWTIFEAVLKQHNKPLPDQTRTLAALAEIDPERRPLFAHFAADAIAHGDDICHFNREQLLEQVIKRSREGYWRPAGAKAEDERLLAVATMAGGFMVEALDDVTEKLLPSWDIDRHPDVFLAMTGRNSGTDIAPLEPDIVGEHFVLTCLAQKNLSDANRARLCDLAWRLNPLGMAQFVSRVMHDFRLHDPASARAFLHIVRSVAAARDDAALWETWSLAAAASIGGDLETLMRNSVLMGPPSKRFFNENLHVSRAPDAARALLDDMCGVAVARDEFSLWWSWSYAALGMMDDLASRDPVAAWTLLDGVLTVAWAKHDEDVLSMWNAFLRNIVNAAAADWIDETRGALKQRDDASLWEQWAEAAARLIVNQGPKIQIAARALLAAMHGLAEERNEPSLWEWWAQASCGLLVDLKSHDLVASRALVSDLLDAVKENPGEVGGWQTKVVGLVLMSAFSLTQDLAGDPGAARAFCAELGIPEEMLKMMQFGERA
jgi:Palmitoyl protein thioesterase